MRICLKNELSEIIRFSEIFEEYTVEKGLPLRLVPLVEMCFDEILTNIVSYGYDDGKEHEITVDINSENNFLVIIIMDDGKEFNPLEVPAPDITTDIDERPIGGLGVFMVRRVSDNVTYCRVEDRNILTLYIRI